MAQLNWTYYSLRGLPYRIDMYHGDDSGHLIVFVNSHIIHIDFKINATSDYSFYIENQMLKLDIKSTDKGYEYELAPQPMDSSQIFEEKIFDKHFWIPLIILIIAVNLIVLFIRWP